MAGYSGRPCFSPGTRVGPGTFLIIIVDFNEAMASSIIYAPLHTLSLPAMQRKSLYLPHKRRRTRDIEGSKPFGLCSLPRGGGGGRRVDRDFSTDDKKGWSSLLILVPSQSVRYAHHYRCIEGRNSFGGLWIAIRYTAHDTEDNAH